MRVYIYVLLSALLGLPPFRPIEKHIEKLLRGKVSGLEDVRVSIHATRIGFLFTGIIRRIEIELSGLEVKGLRAEKFNIGACDVRFRPFDAFVRERMRVLAAGDINWLLRILEKDLEGFFNTQGILLNKMKVTIGDNIVSFRRSAGIAQLFSVDALALTGRLKLSEQRDVLLELDRVSAFGVSPGRPFRDAIMSLANPLLRAADINRLIKRNQIKMLENLKPHSVLEDIAITPGQVDISGELFLLKRTPEDSDKDEDAETGGKADEKDKKQTTNSE